MTTIKLYPDNQPVPEQWKTSQFLLTTLTPAHVELDYAALMVSKEMLRVWSGGPWPQDSFSLEDNLSDLEWHHERHRAREAFTYTVLRPDGGECLGCVYIVSLAMLAHESGHADSLNPPIGDYEAAVRFWVTQPRLAEELDAALLGALVEWFESAWHFNRILFHNRSEDRRQADLFADAGLKQEFSLDLPSRPGPFQFWSFES